MSKLYIYYGTFYDLYYRKLNNGLWCFYHSSVGWRVSGDPQLASRELVLVGNNFKLK